MSLTEEQTEKIMSYSGSMTTREIADKIGCSKTAVANTIKRQKLARTGQLPAHAIYKKLARTCQSSPDSETALPSPMSILNKMLNNLEQEARMYADAVSRQDTDPQAKWEVVQHQKLIQSALRTIGTWYGLDRGDCRTSDADTGTIDSKRARSMTLNEMMEAVDRL